MHVLRSWIHTPTVLAIIYGYAGECQTKLHST